MPPRFEIVVTFVRERFVFDNEDSGTRVIIGDAVIVEPGDGSSTVGKPITIRGDAAEGALKCGLDYRLIGKDVEHPKYGKQFAFTSFTLQTPAGKRAVTVYLQQCKGIGMTVANRLWEQYGDKAVELLRMNPALVAGETQGLTLAKAVEASKFLQENVAVKRSKMDLLALLQGRGFPRKTVDLVIEDYGAASAALIRRSPYLLMQYRGCGFTKTDRLYMELKKPAGALKRQALCMWHGVAKAGQQSGDTWFSANVARAKLSEQLSGADLRAADAMELSIRGGLLETRDWMGSKFVAEGRKARNERRIATYVGDLLAAVPEWPDIEQLRALLRSEDGDPHQFTQLQAALRGTVSILTGSPGTGKTYCVAALVKLLLVMGWKTDEICICAPTGKAAVRVTETMQSKFGIPIVARTIHSTLSVASETRGGWSFEHGEGNPLPFKFVFGDEWSMVDCDLNASFFAAIGEGTHVLLSGDTNQLPPVGHGAPLRDMIAAGVPTGTLTKIRRNSGRIVQCCSEIRTSKRFNPSRKLDPSTGENLLHVELSDPEQQIAVLSKFISQVMSGDKFDAVWDVQVVCAVNRKSQVSRHELNKRLQILLNPMGPPEKGTFQVGDKIINTKNAWIKALVAAPELKDKQGCVYVANGEQAEVLEIAPNKITTRLWSPDRTVIIPRGQQDDDADGDGKDSDDAAEETGETKDTGTGCRWELGYAISVHKSQGSEWPIVLMMIDDHQSARMVQTRNWLYTGISRAQEFCVTIGRMGAIHEALRRDGMNRKTFLQEQLKEQILLPGNSFDTELDLGGLLDGALGDVGDLLDGVELAGASDESIPF